MSAREVLSAVVNSLNQAVNKFQLEEAIAEARETHISSITALYKSKGNTKGGFEQITSTARDVINEVEGSVPENIEDLDIVKLTDGVATELRNKVAAVDKTNLQSLTGELELAEDGFLDVVVSAPFPEALAAVVKNTTTLSSNQIIDVVKNNSEAGEQSDKIEALVKNLFPSFRSQAQQLDKTFNTVQSNITRLLQNSNLGFNTLVENLVESSYKTTTKQLSEVAFKNGVSVPLPNEKVKEIIELQQKGLITQAARVLQGYSDKTLDELEAVIRNINNKASSNVTDAVDRQDIRVERTDTFVNLWREENTPFDSPVFNPVLGNEIISEVVNMKREVTEVIVSFLPGPGATINNYHQGYIDKYNIGFNPHFYIGRDAVIYRGRPLEIDVKSGTPRVTNNHYLRSILISVNVDEKNNTHKISTRQTEKLSNLLQQIIIAKPGIQVYGEKDVGWTYDISVDALDVPQYVKAKFGKQNIASYDPKSEDPLTQEELTKKSIE